MIAMSFQELLGSLDAKTTLTRDRTLALARALESLNIGIEPDVLAGAKLPKPHEKVVLFSVPPGEVASRSTGLPSRHTDFGLGIGRCCRRWRAQCPGNGASPGTGAVLGSPHSEPYP